MGRLLGGREKPCYWVGRLLVKWWAVVAFFELVGCTALRSARSAVLTSAVAIGSGIAKVVFRTMLTG